MESKVNCWEFKQCNREPGGMKVNELGECRRRPTLLVTVSMMGKTPGGYAGPLRAHSVVERSRAHSLKKNFPA